MKFALKPIALAVLVATAPLAGVTHARAPPVPRAQPSAQLAPPASPATKTPIATKAPEDWIIYDDTTYTPVVDEVSRHLAVARKAFDANDPKKAAAELRTVAAELKAQSEVAARIDQARARDENKLAQDSAKRMAATAMKLDAAAAALEAGKITTKAELDKAIDKVARADMERRWLVSDMTTWYPVSEEPQRHFTDAAADYAKKDYKAAAADIRKATSYLRLEAGRATGDAKQELDSSVAELDKLAASVDKGAMKDEQSMARSFAKANHALALEHRSKAASSWARKEYDKAGYELKAAAQGLESGAGWVGAEAKAGASSTVTDTRALGDKLASGATWTRDEIVKGFDSLGNSINEPGKKIAGTKKAAPVAVGS
jgi:hypothetical protein